ncbi:MAG TPA: methyltransferase domain-containing protein [Rubrobacter sp.]
MNTKGVKTFFERVATDWNRMRLAYYDERVIEKVADVSGAGEDSELADVGTGTGFVAAGISARVRRVLAVDNSPAMLDVARKNLSELGIANADLLEGDVRALPLDTWTPLSQTWSSITPRTLRPCSRRWPVW